MDFQHIKHAVATQFAAMSKHQLFCTGVEKDDLWTAYLAAFPAGTNPVFRERTEHDCSCCRHFIRAVGNVVAVIDGKVVSIWDGPVVDPSYQIVSDAMAKLVKSKAIQDEFLHPERTAGTDKTFEDILDKVHTWSHFHVRIPEANYCVGANIATKLSVSRTGHDVFLRALTELSKDAIDTVLELIGQNSLYRGDEHKFAVQGFQKVKIAYDKLKVADRDAFVWLTCMKSAGSVTRIRNTSIGQLLIDLSAGMDMDGAVRKFEAMVAPMNYKRPTALVTPSMVKKAKETLEQLGLTSALERRYATLADVSVNNILFADRSARKVMGGDVFDSIPTKATNKRMAKVEEVSIEQFIANIVPNAESIEVMFENRHQINLTSLVAPVDPTAKQLFKWDNNFSWSYNGDVADSIREKVKQAGGNVTGDLCCRLAWFNFDDLDFHMHEPDGGVIYFGNRGRKSRSGGMLDVDMNAGGGTTREPVENIFYGSRATMQEGIYELIVHSYSRRETSNVGFEVEIDWLGQVTRFSHEKAVASGRKVVVAKFRYSKANGIEMIESLPSSQGAGRQAWSLLTQDFHKVNLLMLSPNFWDGRGVGNKHYFFMLNGCLNDGQARGFFNEFLRDDLKDHRKVIELVGAKMKTETSLDQVSGLGFSSTHRNEILARVKGAFTRTVKVTF